MNAPQCYVIRTSPVLFSPVLNTVPQHKNALVAILARVSKLRRDTNWTLEFVTIHEHSFHFLTTAQSAISARPPQRTNTRSVARCGTSARQNNPHSTRPTKVLPQSFYWTLLDHVPRSLGRFTPGRKEAGTD